MAGAVAGRADREHDRHFHKNADNGCQRRAGFRPEQCNGSSDGQLKEIRGADESAGSRNGMLDFQPFHEHVGQPRIEIDLQRYRDGYQQDIEKPACDVVGLKGEYQD